MRHLSETEKKWIQVIIDEFNRNNKEYVSSYFILSNLYGWANIIKPDIEHSQLLYYELQHEEASKYIDDIKKSHAEICDKAILIELLQKEGYIKIVPSGTKDTTLNLIINESSQCSPLPVPVDSNLIKIIKELEDHHIVCLPNLVEYVNNNFKEPSEIMAEAAQTCAQNSNRIAICTMVISLLALVAAIVALFK